MYALHNYTGMHVNNYICLTCGSGLRGIESVENVYIT